MSSIPLKLKRFGDDEFKDSTQSKINERILDFRDKEARQKLESKRLSGDMPLSRLSTKKQNTRHFAVKT